MTLYELQLTQVQIPFEFDPIRLLRFLCLDLITAPLNYKWQEFLEYCFPRYGRSSNKGYESIPLDDHDVEKNSNAGDDEEEGEDEDIAEGSSPRRHSSHHKATPNKKNRKEKTKSKSKRPKLHWRNIWTKWFIDCITLGAIFNTLAFLIIIGLLKGQPGKIPHNIRTETIPIIVNGYKLWPIANIIAHSVIPFERRIVFFALVALCWNIYLSLVAARL